MRAIWAMLLLLLAPGPGAHAADPARLAEQWRVVSSHDVAVKEISGMSALPPTEAAPTRLIVVTDEGRLDREADTLRDALHVVEIDGHGALSTRTVPLRLRGLLDRIDPSWPSSVSPVDLETVVPVPGRAGHYLLSGERNPEDRTDDGANRLYVITLDEAATEARLVAYLRVYDLVDDTMNDRFEGVALLPPSASSPNRWPIHLLKERTARAGGVPGIARGVLTADAEGRFHLELADDRGHAPLLAHPLVDDPARLSTQSDAAVAPDGRVWILDRWRRQVHVARHADTGRLVLEETLDLWDLVCEVPGEAVPYEPAPPGLPERRGFGRHEAIAFSPDGSTLYLAADLGGSRPSRLTVLEKR